MSKKKQKPLRTRDKILMVILTVYNSILIGLVAYMAWYYLVPHN